MSSPSATETACLQPARKRRKLDNLQSTSQLDIDHLSMDMQDLSTQPMELDSPEAIAKQSTAVGVSTNTLESSGNSSDSSFFRLPIEIRLKIYYYALQHPHGDLDPAWLSPFKRPIIEVLRPDIRHKRDSSEDDMGIVYWGTELMTRLLRVNRQIHSEAVEVLYTEFVFDFKNELPKAGLQFIETIHPDMASLVRSVYINVSIGCRDSAIEPHPWLFYYSLHKPLGVDNGWKHICEGIVKRLPKLRNVYVRASLWEEGFFDNQVPQSRIEDAIMDILNTFSNIEHVQLRPSSHDHGELDKAVQVCQKKHADLRASLSSMFKEVFDMEKLSREAY